MYWTTFVVFFLVCVVSTNAFREQEKICSHNLMINGSRLMNNNRQQVLVLGISHLGCQACRNQAVRYNDLYRDLEYRRIYEADVRLSLINELQAIEFLPGAYYGKVRVLQDNWKDRVVEKLGQHGERLNNLIFDRCGKLVYTQRYPHSNIEDEHNYQQLIRVIVSIVNQKKPCPIPCT